MSENMCEECGECLMYCACDSNPLNVPVLERREPMPKTIEYYEAQQEREGKLILEMKDEISDLKVRNDRLEKKLLQRGN